MNRCEQATGLLSYSRDFTQLKTTQYSGLTWSSNNISLDSMRRHQGPASSLSSLSHTNMHVHAVQGDLPEGAFPTTPRRERLGSGG